MSHARITRNNKALIVLVVDLSGSMAESIFYNGENCTKAKALSSILNSFIDELLFRCRRGSEYLNYIDISVIGYSNDEVYSLLDYISSDKDVFTVNDLINSNVKKEYVSKRRIGADNRYFTQTSEVNCWIEERSEGNTPTFAALTYVNKVINKWIKREDKEELNPPLVIHISDGEATDSDNPMLIEISEKIKAQSTGRGNTLFVNVHLSSSISKSVIFPESVSEIDSQNVYAKLLYDMSSYLPKEMYESLSHFRDIDEDLIEDGVKSVAYNISINELAKILSIGTSTMR